MILSVFADYIYIIMFVAIQYLYEHSQCNNSRPKNEMYVLPYFVTHIYVHAPLFLIEDLRYK